MDEAIIRDSPDVHARNARTPGLTQAFIATLADGSGYVLLADGKVVSTHAAIAGGVKAREALLEVERVVADGSPRSARVKSQYSILWLPS